MSPNSQLSTLGDGKSKLKSVGEIYQIFFRNNWKVRIRAIVTDKLQSPLIGGTVFMMDNKVEQDISRGIIHINDKQFTVQETNPLSVMPITPNFSASSNNSVLQNIKNTKVTLPGQNHLIKTDFREDTEVVVEPWAHNNNPDWPNPQLAKVKDGFIEVKNDSKEPVILQNDVKQIKVSIAKDQRDIGTSFYSLNSARMKNIQEAQSYIHKIKF